jgi:outer membrane biosynthesis protein TonB
LIMSLHKIYVRTRKKRKIPFFRAGMQFTNDWQPIEVDYATMSVLHGEQMLEVTDEPPAGFVVANDAAVDDGGEPKGGAGELIELPPGPKPDPKLDPEPKPKPKADPKPEPEPKTDPKPKADPKPEPKTDPKPDPEKQADVVVVGDDTSPAPAAADTATE